MANPWEHTSSSPIRDYAMIGDTRSAALIARDGSLDWLCWPRFDSPSQFAALLDPARGGRFRIQPRGVYETERRYLPETNVLETRFHSPRGTVAVRDLMPVAAEEAKHVHLMAEHEVLRAVEGLTGDVVIEMSYEPRPGYARTRPRLERRGELGVWCQAGRGVLILASDVPLVLAGDQSQATATIRLRAGERRFFSLSYSEDGPAVMPALGRVAEDRLAGSIRWWREWATRCTYRGPHRAAVVRSALVLKLLSYAPSGAVVAAPTTSLPERIGGERNWDYRYCWLRDASFTLRALSALGYEDEAAAYVDWILHATRLTWPELQVLYDVFGETHLPERSLPHLAGYAGSRPVRIGNDARGQLQLDVYGEVVDAVARFLRSHDRLDRATARFLAGLGRTVCERWREPDEGIWEGRAGRFHHTHSKVLCWVALDRLLALHETHGLVLDRNRFRRERAAIRAAVETHGYNARLGSYTRLFDGDDLDASLLTLPLYGYVDAAQPRMASTWARIHERLGRDGFIYRYRASADDGLPPGEGAFGICSFWAVECQAKGGDRRGAMDVFARLLRAGNDLGLFAEEVDPDTDAALGNFPQAFTHVGLINAALTLEECRSTAAAVTKPPSTAATRKEHGQ